MLRIPAFSLLLIGLLLDTAHAQYASRLGRFEVDEKKGCAPLTITVTNLVVGSCAAGKPCDMNYGDMNPDCQTSNQYCQQQFTHTYNVPGTYKLEVLYQTIGSDDIIITVTPNTQPAFESYGCSGNQVQVKVTDTNYNQYVIDFNDGSPVTVVPSGSLAKATHAYGSSGNKSIAVRGRYLNAADNCITSTQPFIARTTLPVPVINTATVLDASSVQLDYSNVNNIQYRLEIAANSAGPFQQLQTVYNSNSTTVTKLNTEGNFYSFRLGAVDACSNNIQYSNSICTIDFDLTINSGAHDLSWTMVTTGVSSFDINRDQSSYASVAASPYTDTNIVCGTDYCYLVIAAYSNGSRSISIEKCGTAFSSVQPTAIDNVTAQVTGSGVDLSWQPDPAFSATVYRIYRGVPGQAFGEHDQTTTPSYTDSEYRPDNLFCYRVQYTDECGNSSLAGIETCPIRLTATLLADNSIALDWSSYEGWTNGVGDYLIEKYNSSGTLLRTFDAGAATTFTDDIEDLSNQVYLYVVKASPTDAGLGIAISNSATITKQARLSYPLAFTPDQRGPAQNEDFRLFGPYIEEFEMEIFNRWGELLFVTNDPQDGWDGTVRGSPQPEGTYVFKARTTDMAGRPSTQTGSFLLLRKR